MDVLRSTHRRLSVLIDAGHGRDHPGLYDLLERLENLVEAKTGKPVIDESDRRMHYGQA